MGKDIKSYKDLLVWQRSKELVLEIYKMTNNFPNSEIYGLSSQMKRAAVSIPSNIAEGSRRSSKKDYRNFLINAFGSGAELETQIDIVKSLDFGEGVHIKNIENLLEEVMRMLNKMINNLNI